MTGSVGTDERFSCWQRRSGWRGGRAFSTVRCARTFPGPGAIHRPECSRTGRNASFGTGAGDRLIRWRRPPRFLYGGILLYTSSVSHFSGSTSEARCFIAGFGGVLCELSTSGDSCRRRRTSFALALRRRCYHRVARTQPQVRPLLVGCPAQTVRGYEPFMRRSATLLVSHLGSVG